MKKLFLSLAFLPLVWFAAPADAQPYPGKPVRIVVAFAAGGAIDTIVRAAGQQFSRSNS